MKVGIVKYKQSGNIFSVYNSVNSLGVDVGFVKKISDFGKFDKLILPGVGYFNLAMDDLEKTGFDEKIKSFEGYMLGICLGMQLFAEFGFEGGKRKGLGLIKGEVKKVYAEGPVPHMGFNDVKIQKKISSSLFQPKGIGPFYFMHSYEFVNYESAVGLTDYCDHQFVSYVQKDKIHGVQFHPEKSRTAGLKLLQNFVNL